MARQLSNAAQVAKLCKLHCKARGIPCKVSSKNYSGGNSVDVTVFDQPPGIVKELEREFAKYEYGYFNGMTDSYEYTNVRNDCPQTRFLFVKNAYSTELSQRAYTWLRTYVTGFEDFPENYEELCKHYYRRKESTYSASEEVRHVLNGFSPFSGKFYTQTHR